MSLPNFNNLREMLTNTDAMEVAGIVVSVVLIALIISGFVVSKEKVDEQDNDNADLESCRADLFAMLEREV